MLPSSQLLDRSRRRPINWRLQQTNDSTPLLPSNIEDVHRISGGSYAAPAANEPSWSYLKKLLASPRLKVALFITLAIILVQLFIVAHYLGSPLFSKRGRQLVPLTRADLLGRYSWLCHSFAHLNRLQELANLHQVELVVVDRDLLAAVGVSGAAAGDERADEVEFATADSNYKAHQGPGQQKSIIHLAAINETSGGQPNLKAFHKALKNASYSVLKYEDASQTMPHEVYKRRANQFDDVQADALRDLNHLEERLPVSGNHHLLVQQPNFEISKIYTEFMAHLFVVNSSQPAPLSACMPSGRSKAGAAVSSFVVIHIFVLYNYEYAPDKQWIQSSLRLDEIERHKLLTYGVHAVDFGVPLDDYYIQRKRATARLLDVSATIAKFDDPFKLLAVFEPAGQRLLEYANNTYLHCKQSSFNMSGLVGGGRKLSNYLRLLDSARPLQANAFRASLDEQLRVALRFMEVFSQTYGNFSHWLTGSSLLAFHKFCELVIMPTGEQVSKYELDNDASAADDEDKDAKPPSSEQQDLLVSLELGVFADELAEGMLRDLSEAKMIGVTMLSDWRRPNSHVSFHVRDCPNLIFNLHFYELKRDFYQRYFVTRTSLTFDHKFRRKQRAKSGATKAPVDLNSSPLFGQHVFATSNLKLCWTRINRFHPFKVPCDVHDHLRRIYIV